MDGCDSKHQAKKSREVETPRSQILAGKNNAVTSRPPQTRDSSTRYRSPSPSPSTTRYRSPPSPSPSPSTARYRSPSPSPSTARYRSPSPSPSTLASRRCSSPPSRTVRAASDSAPKRSKSAERKCRSTPSSSPSLLSTPVKDSSVDIQISSGKVLSARLPEGLWPSTMRSLSVSLQLDSTSGPVIKKEKPVTSTLSERPLISSSNVRKKVDTPTVERNSISEKKRSALIGKNVSNQSENSKPVDSVSSRLIDQHRWPCRIGGKVASHSLTRSLDLIDKMTRSSIPPVSSRRMSLDGTVKPLQKTATDAARLPSVDDRVKKGLCSIDDNHLQVSRPKKLVPEKSLHKVTSTNSTVKPRPSSPNKIPVSYSSLSRGTSPSPARQSITTRGVSPTPTRKSTPVRGISPTSTRQSTARGISPVPAISSPSKGTSPTPERQAFSTRGISAAPVKLSTPRGTSPTPARQSTPARRNSLDPAIPSTPSRGTSPTPIRPSTPARGVSPTPSTSPSSASVFSFLADFRNWKKSVSDIEDAHQLRLVHNRYLQWQFANARADVVLQTKKVITERTLYNVWNDTLSLFETVTLKRISLHRLKLELKLNSLLNGQISFLNEWVLFERDHISCLSEAVEDFKSGTVRLPVTRGARVDTESLKLAVCSAVDVMQTMGPSICSLLSRVEMMNSLVSRLAFAALQESEMLDQSEALLASIAAMQVEEYSIRTHVIQMSTKKPILEIRSKLAH